MTPSAVTLRRVLILATAAALFCVSANSGARAESFWPGGDRSSGAPPAPGNDPAALVPPDVLKIPQFPVPPKAEVVLGDTVIVGDDEDWSGQVFLSAPYTVVQITQFYRLEMPKVGWVETSIVRSRRTSISYTRGNRVATLRLAPMHDDAKGTDIDLVVSPIQTPATMGQRPPPGAGAQPPGSSQRPRPHP